MKFKKKVIMVMDAEKVLNLLDSDNESVASYNSDNVELLQPLSPAGELSSPQRDDSLVSQVLVSQVNIRGVASFIAIDSCLVTR